MEKKNKSIYEFYIPKTIRLLDELLYTPSYKAKFNFNSVKQIALYDEARVIMIRSKTELAKRILYMFVDENMDLKLIKEWNQNFDKIKCRF